MKPFMSLEFSSFTKLEPLDEALNAEPEDPKQKRSVEDIAAAEKKIKDIKNNNMLFENDLDESALSEVQDPLILDR